MAINSFFTETFTGNILQETFHFVKAILLFSLKQKAILLFCIAFHIVEFCLSNYPGSPSKVAVAVFACKKLSVKTELNNMKSYPKAMSLLFNQRVQSINTTKSKVQIFLLCCLDFFFIA